jgi:hypothetical protein
LSQHLSPHIGDGSLRFGLSPHSDINAIPGSCRALRADDSQTGRRADLVPRSGSSSGSGDVAPHGAPAGENRRASSLSEPGPHNPWVAVSNPAGPIPVHSGSERCSQGTAQRLDHLDIGAAYITPILLIRLHRHRTLLHGRQSPSLPEDLPTRARAENADACVRSVPESTVLGIASRYDLDRASGDDAGRSSDGAPDDRSE